MVNHEEYNGWTNYETWLVALWIDNNEAVQINVQNLMKQKFRYEFEREDALKEMIDEWVFSEMECSGLKADLINAALYEVNWREIMNANLPEKEVADEKSALLKCEMKGGDD